MSLIVSITIPIDKTLRKLSPNVVAGTRGSRMAKAAATKKMRAYSRLKFMEAYPASFRPKWRRAEVRIVWHHPSIRHPDRDNCIASLKAAFDGLTDAGLFDDDRGLIQHPPIFFVDGENPRVTLHFSAL